MNSIPISDRLLRSLASRPVHDADLAKAFENGEARTKKASRSFPRRFISNDVRQHPISPDKVESRRRKRMLGGSSGMPDWMRGHYSEGERASLCVVVLEVKKKGFCDLTINAIAACAGVSRTTVQNALRKAKALVHIAVQERPGVAGQLSMTNIIKVVSSGWKAWLRRVGSGFKSLYPSQMKDHKQRRTVSEDRPQGAYEKADEAATWAITIAEPNARLHSEILPLEMRVRKFADPESIPYGNTFPIVTGCAHVHRRKAL